MTEINLTGVWPEWKIEKQIGKGTFGAVYQAVRESDNLTSYAAIKFISIPQDPYELESLRADGLDLQATRAYLKRIVDDFVNEIRLLESFKGIQNIVSIEDYKVVEKADGLGWDIYIRMELLTPFSAYICDKKLTEREVIQLGCDICTALDICSRKNIIHRDIKPENIFVNSFGSFKLGDFDTARQMESLTGGLSQKGTYNYMAPEVVSGEDYDVRVDVYSLGLVLYRLMNGNRLPFISEKQLLSPSERRAAFERRVRGEALPAPCEASPALAQVILKACAFDPRDRYASAAEMRRALRELEREPVPALAAAPAPEPKQGKKPASQGKKPAPRRGKPAAANKKAKARDSRLAVWILSSLAVLVLVLCGVLAWLSTAHPTQMEIWRVPEKREYIVGDTLDPTGLQMLVYYDDGSCGTVEEGFRCSPKKLKTVGTQEITVSYRGFQDTFSVEVTSVPYSLRVVTPPDRTFYEVGEELDTKGLSLELLYNDGTSETVTKDFTCESVVFDELGTRQIEVSYKGLTATFLVDVTQITGIRVAEPPKKTDYLVGESLETQGLTLEVIYENGKSRTVAEGFSCSPTGFGRTTINKVEVTYQDYTASFPVTVSKAESISILTPPDKTEYIVGDQLKLKGLTFEVTYSNGETRTLDWQDPDYYCSYDYLLYPGTRTITLNYRGLKDTFTVSVEDDGSQPVPESKPTPVVDYENIDVRMGVFYDTATGYGCNQDGRAVFWELQIKIPAREEWALYNAWEITDCSWASKPELMNWGEGTDFEGAKAGKTYIGHAFDPGIEDTVEDDAASFSVFLPDDPGIAGEQSVTVKAAGEERTIHFTLIYLGDYETGMGWGVKDSWI